MLYTEENTRIQLFLENYKYYILENPIILRIVNKFFFGILIFALKIYENYWLYWLYWLWIIWLFFLFVYIY